MAYDHSNPMAEQARIKFEEVLHKHIKHCIGYSNEVAGIFMTMDFITLTGVVLLVEREKNIQAQINDPPERYTEESLLSDLQDAGFDDIKKSKMLIKLMEQKQYVMINETGYLVTTEFASKITQLLNIIFPSMPGLNLITYCNQILDEVLDNRKEMDLALAQLNKTFQTQSVSLRKKSETSNKTPSNRMKKTAIPIAVSNVPSRIQQILSAKTRRIAMS